jgi:hypothetical protein
MRIAPIAAAATALLLTLVATPAVAQYRSLDERIADHNAMVSEFNGLLEDCNDGDYEACERRAELKPQLDAEEAALKSQGGLLLDKNGKPVYRTGLWFALGGGGGTMGIGCEGCTTERLGGLTGQAAVGATLSPQILLGLEGNGWIKTEGEGYMTLGQLALVSQLYPTRTSGLFVKGGVGTGRVNVEPVGEDAATESGLSFIAGLGWEMGGDDASFFITPSVTYMRTNLDGGNVNVFSAGLSMTLH